MKSALSLALASSVLLASALGLAACDSEDPSPVEATRYPLELGAPCVEAGDCVAGLLCTRVVDPPSADYPYCTKACGGLDDTTSCGDGAFCAQAQWHTDRDEWATKGLPEFECRRACDSLSFCEDLHSASTGCVEFTGNPTGKTSCGIEG